MNKKQMKKQLQDMKQMLEEMKQERVDAIVVYSDDSDFMKDLDEDILLCSLTINDLTRQLTTKTR